MIVLQIALFLIILLVAIVAGGFIFWMLFMKDAPLLDEQDGTLTLSNSQLNL
jgi:hypothetical protein